MSHGEGTVTWKGEIDGPRVKFITTAGEGVTADSIIGFAAPAQARQIAAMLVGLAERCERWEGLSGHAQQDVELMLPVVRYTLRDSPMRRG